MAYNSSAITFVFAVWRSPSSVTPLKKSNKKNPQSKENNLCRSLIIYVTLTLLHQDFQSANLQIIHVAFCKREPNN